MLSGALGHARSRPLSSPTDGTFYQLRRSRHLASAPVRRWTWRLKDIAVAEQEPSAARCCHVQISPSIRYTPRADAGADLTDSGNDRRARLEHRHVVQEARAGNRVGVLVPCQLPQLGDAVAKARSGGTPKCRTPLRCRSRSTAAIDSDLRCGTVRLGAATLEQDPPWALLKSLHGERNGRPAAGRRDVYVRVGSHFAQAGAP